MKIYKVTKDCFLGKKGDFVRVYDDYGFGLRCRNISQGKDFPIKTFPSEDLIRALEVCPPKTIHKGTKLNSSPQNTENIIGFEFHGNSIKCYKDQGIEYTCEVFYVPKNFAHIYRIRSSDPYEYGKLLDMYISYPKFLKIKRYPCNREKIKVLEKEYNQARW